MRWLDGITNAVVVNLGKILGDDEGQGGLVRCIPWGHKESDMIWQLKNNKNALGISKTEIGNTSHLMCPWNAFH